MPVAFPPLSLLSFPSISPTAVHQFLLHVRIRCVALANQNADRISQHRASDRLDALGERRAKEKTLQMGVRTRGHDLVDLRVSRRTRRDLLDEPVFEELVSLVQHEDLGPSELDGVRVDGADEAERRADETVHGLVSLREQMHGGLG